MDVRPIDANALREELNTLNVILGGKLIFHPEARKSVLDAIAVAPTLDYAPVAHGEWKPLEEPQWNCFGLITIGYRCSQCGHEEPHNIYLYCPNCGARMDGGKKDG